MSDIGELFSRDPLKLTREDRAAIIAKYREARNQFVLGVKSAGNAKKIKGGEVKIKDLDIDLSDLGL